MRIILLVLLVILTEVSWAAKPSKGYVLGVFPHLSASQLAMIYTPLTKYISARLKKPVKMRTKKQFAQFEKALKRGDYDIVIVQPFDYIWAHDKYGYIPLAQKRKRITTVIAVENASPILDLEDIKGKTLALPPESSAVSYLTLLALRQAGLDPQQDVKLKYTKSHFACMQLVLIGFADACSCASQVVTLFERKAGERYRSFSIAQSIPSFVMMAHSRVPKSDITLIKQAILKWEGNAKVLNVYGDNANEPVYQAFEDKDYDIIRAYAKALNLH